MPGLKLNHVSKKGYWQLSSNELNLNDFIPMGHVTLAAITETTILVPYLQNKSSHFCSLEDSAPDLQMSCNSFEDQVHCLLMSGSDLTCLFKDQRVQGR